MARTIRVRAIIYHGGRYLFVRHPAGTAWVLPGGKLDDGETLQDGLIRELQEELGVSARIGRLLYVQQLFKGDDESLEFFFEVTNGDAFLQIDLSSTSHGSREISSQAFINASQESVLPTFLQGLSADGVFHENAQIFVERH